MQNNKIIKFLKELNLSIFNENELVDKDVIVLFPGKFQPMGQHQREEYFRLTRQFGKDNVYVVTDDKFNSNTNPLNFEEKTTIIKRHGIKNIEKAINPFMPVELFENLDETKTTIIIAVSSKNLSKLKGFKRLTKYNKSSHLPIKDIQNPYIYYTLTNNVKYTLPDFGELNSKNIFKALSDRQAKLAELKSRFISVFGWFDANIFNTVMEKFNSTRGKLKDGKEDLKPLQMVTRTFWNKVYNEVINENTLNEVATLPPLMLKQLADIAKQRFYKLETFITSETSVEQFEKLIESNFKRTINEITKESLRVINKFIRSEQYVIDLKSQDIDAYNQVKLHQFNIQVRNKDVSIQHQYNKLKNLIGLVLDDELPGTFIDKLNRAKTNDNWKDYQLEIKRLKNYNDFSIGNRALFDSDGSIYDGDYNSLLEINFDWFLVYIKIMLAKNNIIEMTPKKIIDDYIDNVYIGLLSHELIHFVQSIKQQITSGERQYAKYEFQNAEKIGNEKFNKMYLSDKGEIGAHAYQFVIDLKGAYPNKSSDELLRMFQSGKLPKKKFSPMYNYIGYYMNRLNNKKQDSTVKRFIKTVFLILKKD